MRKVCFSSLQLFDHENHVNQDASNYIFSTEGHIFRLDSQFRKRTEERKGRKYPQRAVKVSSYTRSPVRYNDSIGVSLAFVFGKVSSVVNHIVWFVDVSGRRAGGRSVGRSVSLLVGRSVVTKPAFAALLNICLFLSVRCSVAMPTVLYQWMFDTGKQSRQQLGSNRAS